MPKKVNREKKISKKYAPDKGFYSHMTHASMQKNEYSVKVIGDGFSDAYVPKTPKTDRGL